MWSRSSCLSALSPRPTRWRCKTTVTAPRSATTTAPQENAEHRPAGRFLQFLAKDVPALGYARFNVVEGVPVPVDVSQPGQPVIENEYYRVRFSPLDASIGSIIQRDNGRELVNTDAILGLNAYVFDRYGSSTKVDHLSGRLFTRQLDLIAERVTGENAVVVRRETSQLGDSITVDTRAPGCERLLTTISTWREIPRVDITNRMFKLRTVEKAERVLCVSVRGNGPRAPL